MTKYLLTITFLAIGLLSVLLLSCQKEGGRLLEVVEDSFGSDAKLQLDGKYSTWDNGDLIRINGTTAEVVRKENGHAYIAASAASDVNMAVFPSTLCDAIGGETITVTLPSEYHYSVANGHQVLPMPMAAVSAGGSPMHFRHLTGALLLRISGTMTLESLTVSSNRYQLSGSRTLDFGNINGQTPVVADNAQQRQVTMLFDNLELDGTVDVIVPVAAVGTDNLFTVAVEARYQGSRYHYSRTQTTGGSLGQDTLAYAAIDNVTSGTGSLLFSGSGEGNQPFLIATKNDFLVFVDAVNNHWTFRNGGGTQYGTQCFKLTDSIDLQGATITTLNNFTGKYFDGNGFAIKNFTINSIIVNGDACCGLFHSISEETTIKNLILRNITLKHVGASSTPIYASPLCAKAGNCEITNSIVNGVVLDVSGTYSDITYGGIIGYHCVGAGIISNCSVIGNQDIPNISATFNYGGLVGKKGKESNVSTSLSISNCIVTEPSITINSSKVINSGGIIGSITSSSVTISNTDWSGTKTINSSKAIYAGGIVGRFVSSSLTVNNECNPSGTITVNSDVTSYLGAYIGYANAAATVPSFPSGSTLTLTLNNTSVTKTIGNQ